MSKKIILRQSVKSGVAVVFFFGLGMASINAQTTQTTQPTGKVGINTTNPTETLDVKGKVRIQELYTDNQQTGTNNNATFTATNVVTVDDNGVLGKKPLSSIIMPTIPTEPWQVARGTTQATSNSQDIYQSGKVGIGDFGTGKSLTEKLEVIGNTSVKGRLNLIDSSDDNNKFLTYTEGKQLLFDKKITVPTLKATQTGVMASLTNEGKLYLGYDLKKPDGETIYTKDANILLDGLNGKVAIGHNSPAEALDVKGKAKIQTIDKQTATTGLDMVVVGSDGVLKKADIPTGGGSGNGVKNHTGSNDAVKCNAANAGTIHYKEGVTVNGNTKSTSVMGFCMKTANGKYRWFYIFGGAGTTAGSEAEAPNFGEGIQ